MKRTAEFVGSHDRVVVVSHIRPDGDAVGSVLGLTNFLKGAGIEAYPVLKHGVPTVFSFVPGADEVLTTLPEGDLYILVDASDWERTGFPKPDAPVVRFDHHLTGERYSQYDLLDEEAPSATSLILRFLREWNEEGIDVDVALPLYVGLLTDTGSFKNREGTRAFEDALYLVGRGVNPRKVAELIFREKPIEMYRLLSLALKTLRVVEDGKVAYMVVRREFFEEVGATREHSEGFVEYPLSVRGVVVAMKVEWDPDGYWKVGLRSKDGGPNVAAIAEKFGGGGHYFSAGCRLFGTEEEVIAALLAEIRKALNGEV
ncbi:MAG: bifunctional oligoribonuclease/PAP phosphatase NrnA [Thermotogae bacterium]|nr:bifunctional oligoribonuclease/PAP phosphatase NrnA [Thermotogota bacterium]